MYESHGSKRGSVGVLVAIVVHLGLVTRSGWLAIPSRTRPPGIPSLCIKTIVKMRITRTHQRLRYHMARVSLYQAVDQGTRLKRERRCLAIKTNNQMDETGSTVPLTTCDIGRRHAGERDVGGDMRLAGDVPRSHAAILVGLQ